MTNKKARGLNGVVFLVFVVFLFAALWFTNQFDQREKEITWKNFQQLVQNDKIESVEVNQNKTVDQYIADKIVVFYQPLYHH